MCCCFPSKCLKLFIFIGCIILLGIGAVLIWVGYFISKMTALDSLDIDYIDSAWIIIVVCGCVSIAIAFLGFFGAWKNKALLLGIFIFFAIIIGILLIAFGAALIVGRKFSEDYLGSESKCLDHLENANEGCDLAGEAMCHLYCPCKADNSYMNELREKYKTADTQNQIYAYKDIGAKTIKDCDPCIEVEKYKDQAKDSISEDQYNELVKWVKDNIGYDISTDDCSVTAEEYKDRYFDDSVRKYFPLLKWIENTFECSGLCTPQEVYLFSDADNGKPSGSCRGELNDWVKEKFLQFGIISIIFGVYVLIVVIFACSVCCCSKKDKPHETDPHSIESKRVDEEDNLNTKKKSKDQDENNEPHIIQKSDNDS